MWEALIPAFLQIAGSLLGGNTKQPTPGVAGTAGGSSTDPNTSSDTPPASDPQSSDPLGGSPVQNYSSIGVSPTIPAPSQPGIPGGSASAGGGLSGITNLVSGVIKGGENVLKKGWDAITSIF